MAKVSSIPSGEDSENEVQSGSKESPKVVERNKSVDVDAEGESEEEEYEIEAILDAKRGSFPQGRMGYYVKWKGYDETENSWVDEQDAGNATALIEAFWKKTKKPRKSMDAKTPKQPRKSVVQEDGTESAVRKRGRKSQTAFSEDAPKEARPAKKAKKNGRLDSERLNGSEEDEIILSDMSKYMDVGDWEHLVEGIDTIEREVDNSLFVYFRLKNGERIKEGSALCSARFPQKLIKFYESNLRWKSATGSDHGDDT